MSLEPLAQLCLSRILRARCADANAVYKCAWPWPYVLYAYIFQVCVLRRKAARKSCASGSLI